MTSKKTSKPKERLIRVVLKASGSGENLRLKLLGMEQMPYLRTKREFVEYVRSKESREDDVDSYDYGFDDLVDDYDADEKVDEKGNPRKRRVARKVDESDDESDDAFDDEEEDDYDDDDEEEDEDGEQ